MKKNILLMLAHSNEREFLPSVLRYAAHANWTTISLVPYELGTQGRFPDTRFDGAILHISTPAALRQARNLECPVVNISQSIPAPEFPLCTYDNHEVGVLAARHLTDCGARWFGMILSTHEFSKCRLAGFVSELASRGFTLPPENILHSSEMGSASIKKKMKAWPDGFGLFTISDHDGRSALNTLYGIGRKVPEQVAVVSCNNDLPLCLECSPPLSSIILPRVEVGETACRLLEKMMRKKGAIPARSILKPKQVAVRESSDVKMTDDPQITRALQILKTPEGLRLNADELSQRLAMARRTLDRRFWRHMGCPAADHIRHLRLEKAGELLRSTEQTVGEIALQVGYQSAAHLSRTMLKVNGKRPSDFRSGDSTSAEPLR